MVNIMSTLVNRKLRGTYVAKVTACAPKGLKPNMLHTTLASG